MLKDILEAALEGEMEGHLDDEQRSNGNRKNGKTSKRLKTADGTIDLDTPRDRTSSFEPQIIKKRETILAESLESKIISMYGHGMSLRDISTHIKDMYDTDISATTLSSITDKVIPLVKEWQAHPLEPLYCIIWLDAMFYKVKEEGKMVNRCVYNILGINTADGFKLRVPLNVNEDGSIGCAAEVPEGSSVCIMATDAVSTREAAATAARAALQQLNGNPPHVALFFDCVATRLRMGREFENELAALNDVLGGTPFAGCNSYGQVARTEGQFNGFHNCTAVVCVLSA